MLVSQSSSEYLNNYAENSEELPVEVIKTDIAVVGGGLAGVCAAIAAARMGSKVALVQDRPVLGGNSSSEIRIWTRGATGGGNILSEEMGILGELKMKNLQRNIEGNVVIWDEILLESVLEEPGISLYLNTHITGVEKDGEKISKVNGFQLTTEKEFEFCAEIFIDASGDATVGFRSGAPMMTCKESKLDYGEDLAPDERQQTVLGSTIVFYTKEAKQPVKFVPPSYAYSIEKIESIVGTGGRIVNEKMNGPDFWWIEFGGLKNTIQDNQEISLELKKIAMGVWNYIKNSGKFDADNLTLEWVGNLPGKRESRRLIGNYVLTANDLMQRKRFDDAVCYGGWYIDFHPAEGTYAKEDNCIQIPVLPYQIPLRCLYTDGVPNLLFAGRSIATTHSAFASTRVMNTCALTGEAAGTAAGYCIGKGLLTPQLTPEDVSNIRLHLVNNDMFIPGERIIDPLNKAANCSIEASSVGWVEYGRHAGSKSVENELFIAAAVPKDCTTLSILAKAKKEATLLAKLGYSHLPSRLIDECELGSVELEIAKADEEIWLEVTVPEDAKGKFLVLRFEDNADIAIKVAENYQTGYIMGESSSPRYCSPCVKIDKSESIFAPHNLLNGYTRPYGELNMWSPAESDTQPYVILSWDEAQTISKVMLYLNPDLSKEIPSSRTESFSTHHLFEPRTEMPPKLAKDITISVWSGEGWQIVAEVKDNWQRLCKVEFAQVTTNKLKITINEAYGQPVEIFQINIY